MAGQTRPVQTASVNLPTEIVRKVKVIVAHRGTIISEYLAGLVKDKVDRDYRKVAIELNDLGEAGA
jgi:hypothetical protein